MSEYERVRDYSDWIVNKRKYVLFEHFHHTDETPLELYRKLIDYYVRSTTNYDINSFVYIHSKDCAIEGLYKVTHDSVYKLYQQKQCEFHLVNE